jgi:WD40 repeat protein
MMKKINNNSFGLQDVVNCFYVGDTHLYTASNDKTIKVWRLDTGALLKTLEGHIQGVCCLAMNDGLLYSGSFDSTIMKWDIKDMASVNTYKGHIEVRSCAHVFCLRIFHGNWYFVFFCCTSHAIQATNKRRFLIKTHSIWTCECRSIQIHTRMDPHTHASKYYMHTHQHTHTLTHAPQAHKNSHTHTCMNSHAYSFLSCNAGECCVE